MKNRNVFHTSILSQLTPDNLNIPDESNKINIDLEYDVDADVDENETDDEDIDGSDSDGNISEFDF